MPTRSIPPGELERAFARARQLRAELARKERAINRKAEALARGLAALIEPGMHLYRRSVGLHAFDVGGVVCVAAAYLECEDHDYRYRYAVLCGGEAARRALRTAELDPGDSDEPEPARRVAIATYDDYIDFVDRLPTYLADVARSLEERVQHTETAAGTISRGRRQITTMAKRRERRPSTSAGPVVEGA